MPCNTRRITSHGTWRQLISPAFLLTRSKKHYLTIEYNDPSGEAQSVIVRLNKKNARAAVATATAQTSKSVEQIEEK
jgi:hypothetical protein